MRENTYWLIIVLKKGHAFEMNETNTEWIGECPAIKQHTEEGGAGEASSEVKSTWRLVNVTHQRCME